MGREEGSERGSVQGKRTGVEQRATPIRCFLKATERPQKKRRQKGVGVGYWKMNGLEDKCMQAGVG